MKFKKKIGSLLAAAVLTTTMATGAMVFADGPNTNSTNTQTKQTERANNKAKKNGENIRKGDCDGSGQGDRSRGGNGEHKENGNCDGSGQGDGQGNGSCDGSCEVTK